MGDSAISAEKAGSGVEELLQPCIDVIYGGDYYRATLSKVVESYLKGRPTHCREIARKANLHPVLVNKALKTLEKCGYVEALEREAAPKKGVRKPYRPTPLGVVMHAILTLPHLRERGTSEERRGVEEEYAYGVACWFAEELPPLLGDIYVLQTRSQKPNRRAEIEKGYKVALLAINLLCIAARKVEGASTDLKLLALRLALDLGRIIALLNEVKDVPLLWCFEAVRSVYKDPQEVDTDRLVNVCLEEVSYLERILNILKTMLQPALGSRQEHSRSLITS
jgi:DNA-binding HxlR family transcriptional regulator